MLGHASGGVAVVLSEGQMKQMFSVIAEFLGVLVIVFAALGAADIIDFHVCIKGAGECKIISMDEYRTLIGAQK